ncbi:MAG: hypothetical protein EZS28_019067 [Streblomastix strix]|uniref:Uncharacterized protein n=1 Tax=Streblomastix strix TaxID=222440 RepID=A0A5J4VS50_9EUKA|nr:MAG: hypothetical protein EZS28_019067 [Streblomastix strix]
MLTANEGIMILKRIEIENCSTIQGGGGIRISLISGESVQIIDSKIINCSSKYGGGIYLTSSYPGSLYLRGTLLNNCNADLNGGGIFAEVGYQTQTILDNNCEIYQCTSNKGNGGGICIIAHSLSTQHILIQDAYIHECSAIEDESRDTQPTTGYGGGILLAGTQDYDVSSRRLTLKGLKIYGNTASRGGQSIYIAITKVVEWCKLGIAGEYVKGNYSDYLSDKHDIIGVPKEYGDFIDRTTIQLKQLQNYLEDYWNFPKGSIWHISNRDVTPTGNDQTGCALISNPCETIEFALLQISIEKELSETTPTSEKRIGITEYGFDLNSPIKFDPPTSYTNVIKIMKQLYGTDEQMAEQAELKINKGGDASNIEDEHKGWISIIEDMKLCIYGIKIITDQSKLTIPVIYVEESNSILDLNSITFSGINLSPTSEAKGIIHININNQQFNMENCSFENIEIQNKGGNAIRFQNNGQSTFSGTLTKCQFKNINSQSDSNESGGSAIYGYIGQNSELQIIGPTEFRSCSSKTSSGGSIYADIISSGQLIIKNECKFIGCISEDGNGGGIFANIDGINSKLILENEIIFENCQSSSGGGLSTIINNGGLLAISGETSFIRCKSILQHGGGISASINGENSKIESSGTISFDHCESKQYGGGIYVSVINKGSIIISNTLILQSCSSSNGGGIYGSIDFTSQFQFVINDALIKECQAKSDSTSTYPTGYGGGIFLTGNGDYSAQSNSLNFKGINISDNSANNGGQSIYVIMSKLKEWCRYGTAGEYVKGNYSDAYSNQNELQGIPISFEQFLSLSSEQRTKIQISLKYYWNLPQQDIWHIQSGTSQTLTPEDQFYCGKIDEPCESIEYALKQISVRKGGSETSDIPEKKIGITEVGFELTNPIELNPSITHTNKITIMKQLYGTSSAMIDNSQLKIKKGSNDSNIENGKSGWISLIQQGLQLSLNFINIITDQSKLTIPIIYIEESNSILDLNSITFSGINLSPTSEAKGIIHININNQQFNMENCSFEDIEIQNKGGNAIRLLNVNSLPFSSYIQSSVFNNINSVYASNGQGGSAIYAEIREQNQIIFDDNCQFIQCVSNQGNGGAMFLDIDFASSFSFIINNTLIKECQAKSDSTSTYPTGYGGGIFVTGSGDYSAQSNSLNFKGLKIHGNIADNGGLSLYVAMTNVVEWCKFGDFGEYVKGNYSDAYSNFSEIEGIALNWSQFNIFTLEDIQSQQKPLQYYWTHFAALSSVNAVLDESNIEQPLHFSITGSNMIPGKLCKVLFDNSFEMVYPPDDGVTPPIHIEGDSQGEQIATFGMKDYSWFDSSKQYNALISNDRKIFTGADGNEDQAIQLDIKIETQDSTKVSHIPWWEKQQQKLKQY